MIWIYIEVDQVFSLRLISLMTRCFPGGADEDEETEDLGIYNVENVTVAGGKFTDIRRAIASICRGGVDETTLGPIVVFEGSEFTNTGLGARNQIKASVNFHGVQNLLISNSKSHASAPLELYRANGEPITKIMW